MSDLLASIREAWAKAKAENKRAFEAIRHYEFVRGGPCAFWHPKWRIWIDIVSGKSDHFLICGDAGFSQMSEPEVLELMKQLRKEFGE